jgi:hypothetical protein
MKTLDLKSVFVGVLVTMLIVAFTLAVTAEKSPRAWEYKVVRSHIHEYEASINRAASDGWEVVAVGPPPISGDTRAFAVMKRPRARQSAGWWKFWKK